MIQEFSLNQINRVAKDLVSSFTSKIVLLQGDLGAGKTTLVRSLVKALGSNSSVSSPTFGIVHEYNLPDDVVFHIDLYRIEHFSALAQFGFEEYVDSGSYCFIEWPQIGMPYIPEDHHLISLEAQNDHTRKISFT